MTTSPNKPDVDLLVDEEIWGHRIYNEQTPWLCFLEFLNVLYSEYKEGHAFVETTPNTLGYIPQHRLYLRNILFNNPRLVVVMKETNNDEGRWQRWLQYMQEDCAGISSSANFQYLKKRFGKFSEFAKFVDFLRGTAIEGNSNKRWSSKFVFPYGPACLYEDLAVSQRDTLSNDRRFFARTGEILYLMLCRSGKGQTLLTFFVPMIFKRDSKWNRFVEALQPDADQEPIQDKKREGAYLPLGNRDEYLQLAEDWLHLFDCAMPGYDALPHLVTIMGLHMIRYILQRANEVRQHSAPITFVLEIISHEKNSVHQLANESFRENNRLTQQAISNYIDQRISSPQWQSAISRNDIESVALLFKNDFSWKDVQDIESKANAENAIQEFKDRALSRHQKHLELVHRTWGGYIGLSSKRNSRNTRYTPQDSLLRTLVLCNVPQRMEFQAFLEKLYKNYGFIIGPKQALNCFDAKKAEQDDFTINAKRLEDRLASLGLLKRLSDAYAYVENPFFQEFQQ